MKKLHLIYALLFVATFVSCKDEEEEPTFKKEAFIGSWERTSTTVDQEDCTNGTEELEFTQTQINITSSCDGIEISYDADYTFDNKRTISLEIFGIEGSFVIQELTATTLKADLYQGNTKQGTSTYKKK
jgi:hypothetical protein